VLFCIVLILLPLPAYPTSARGMLEANPLMIVWNFLHAHAFGTKQ